MKKLLMIAIAGASFHLQAQPLPNPLTLGQALEVSKTQNLLQKQQQVDVELSQSRLSQLDDTYKTQAKLDFQLAKRAEFSDGTNNSHAFLHLSQVLFDQNTEIQQHDKQSALATEKFKLKQLQTEKQVAVMRAFFDVVLADMRYETILEELAISAIREGRIRDDYDMQYASEVALLEKQTQTQINVGKRIEAEAEQITTRAKLAQVLGIAYENRPDDLVKPSFKHLFDKQLDEFEAWQAKLLKKNPDLLDMERVLASLKKQRQDELDNREILISSNARLGEQGYQRDKNGKWRLGLNLSMPLGQSDKQKRKVAELALNIKKQQLAIEQFREKINQQALAYWLKLRTLKQLNKSLVIELDYRDLYLEKARANYEMQIKSDIGFAMTNYTDSEWKLAKNEFDYVITLAKLKQLVGEEHEL